MLAPILAFTADEAWEFVPGKATGSVHLAEWQPRKLPVDPIAEQADLETVVQTCANALPELEKARQAKTIGKSLEAKLTIAGPAEALAAATANAERAAGVVERVPTGNSPASGEGLVSLLSAKPPAKNASAAGIGKPTVGVVPEHPTICARCVEAVKVAS